MGLAFEVMSHVRFGLAEDGTSIGLFGQALLMFNPRILTL